MYAHTYTCVKINVNIHACIHTGCQGHFEVKKKSGESLKTENSGRNYSVAAVGISAALFSSPHLFVFSILEGSELW